MILTDQDISGFTVLLYNTCIAFSFLAVVTVTILDDNLPENDESFIIQLTDPRGGATVSAYDHIAIIILANDNVAGIFGFNTTSVLAKEGRL